MKNNIKVSFLIIVIFFILTKISYSNDIFNFDVKEIEIKENGDRFIGKGGGIAKSSDLSHVWLRRFIYRYVAQEARDGMWRPRRVIQNSLLF